MMVLNQSLGFRQLNQGLAQTFCLPRLRSTKAIGVKRHVLFECSRSPKFRNSEIGSQLFGSCYQVGWQQVGWQQVLFASTSANQLQLIEIQPNFSRLRVGVKAKLTTKEGTSNIPLGCSAPNRSQQQGPLSTMNQGRGNAGDNTQCTLSRDNSVGRITDTLIGHPSDPGMYRIIGRLSRAIIHIRYAMHLLTQQRLERGEPPAAST